MYFYFYCLVTTTPSTSKTKDLSEELLPPPQLCQAIIQNKTNKAAINHKTKANKILTLQMTFATTTTTTNELKFAQTCTMLSQESKIQAVKIKKLANQLLKCYGQVS